MGGEVTVHLERRRNKTYEVTGKPRHLTVFQDHGDIRLMESEGGEEWAAVPFRVVHATPLLTLPLQPDEADDLSRALHDAAVAARRQKPDSGPTHWRLRDEIKRGRQLT